MGVIYKIVNKLNGKIYIGKTKRLRESYYGSGLSITYAIKKYGKENFDRTIIEECDDTNLSSREIYWIGYYQSNNNQYGYNISRGGEGGDHYWSTLTDEQKILHNQKISSGRKSGKQSRERSDKTKKLQSEKFWKRVQSDPAWLGKRADAKRQPYTCIDHNLRTVIHVTNLDVYCIEHQLDSNAMKYNARVMKSLYLNRWSCRKGHLTGSIDHIIGECTDQINAAGIFAKNKMKSMNKSGARNPNAKRVHLVHTDGREIIFDGNLYKDCLTLTGICYKNILQLTQQTVSEIDGWKLA
jgi:group I intron endonuclease